MRQTDVTLVVGGRHKARVVALIPEEPERLPGLTKPVSARQGQYEGGEYVSGAQTMSASMCPKSG